MNKIEIKIDAKVAEIQTLRDVLKNSAATLREIERLHLITFRMDLSTGLSPIDGDKP